MIKRALDFCAALLALLLLWPVMVVTALLVRQRLGSPVLFRQARPGLHGRAFMLCKFRTMRDAFDETGEPLPDIERLTPFGGFLRRASLDELPQLFNVLRGDMSLVGPRPLLMEYLSLYNAEQGRRHEVRPGITGWSQVNGRNALSWEEKLSLDVWYVDNQSLWLDLCILARTVNKVFSGSGVAKDGFATTDRFRGTKTGSHEE